MISRFQAGMKKRSICSGVAWLSSVGRNIPRWRSKGSGLSGCTHLGHAAQEGWRGRGGKWRRKAGGDMGTKKSKAGRWKVEHPCKYRWMRRKRCIQSMLPMEEENMEKRWERTKWQKVVQASSEGVTKTNSLWAYHANWNCWFDHTVTKIVLETLLHQIPAQPIFESPSVAR